MIDVGDFRELVVRPALDHLRGYHPAMGSIAAEELLIGVAIVESWIGAIRQRGGGPALGPFQMEPATNAALWHYLGRKAELRDLVLATVVPGQSLSGQLAWNWLHGAVMCRVHFWRFPEPMPVTLEGQAKLWKRRYNTVKGRGTVAEYLRRYRLKVELTTA